MADWTIRLDFDSDEDGVFEPGTDDVATETTITAADGSYSFVDLQPGLYHA